MLSDVDLSEVKGLESVRHYGPSTIGIDTVYASKGRIPEAFLRGAGVPDEFITYMGSLVGRTIEFYSCFISYSSKDQEFAERLHADLQAKGVRCWFAPEDMKVGGSWDRLDESIRLHDKLLVVLSANSMGSEWVKTEIRRAVTEKEGQGGTPEVVSYQPGAVQRRPGLGDFRCGYQEGFGGRGQRVLHP